MSQNHPAELARAGDRELPTIFNVKFTFASYG